MYRSGFSRSRHWPIAIEPDKFKQADPLAEIKNLVDLWQQKFSRQPTEETAGDLMKLQNLFYNVRFQALPDQVPNGLLELEKMTGVTTIPVMLQPRLQGKTVSRENFLRVFNLYRSELSGLQARIFRKKFILRTKFARVARNQLIYAPKDRTWTPPSHLKASQAPIGELLSSELFENDDDGIPVVERFSDVVGSSHFEARRDFNGFTSYLRQAPHDWCLDLGLRSVEEQRPGLRVDKGGIEKTNQVEGCFGRLIGPSMYKSILDETLQDKGLECGDYTLLVEQQYTQETSFTDGQLEIKATPDTCWSELALPVKKSLKEVQPVTLDQTIIGIDLGEAGIGYAVLDAKSLDIIETGTIAIRSIRRLITAVGRYRKRTQPRQKFQERSSTALEKLRDNVTGDVLHHIDSLCAKFQGMPVLESSVAHLAAGANQLKLVYDRVVHAYTYSDIDAHKSARADHWCGGDRWEHPFLEQWELKKTDDGWQRTSRKKKVQMFPGVAVHPAGTSQVCCKCQRNPVAALRAAHGEAKGKSVEIDDGSRIAVADGALMLRQQYDPNLPDEIKGQIAKTYRRRKERPPFVFPMKVSGGRMSYRDALHNLRGQLRQGQQSTRSRDTTQSIYECAYADCGNKMHADENAAINIARKWIDERLAD